MSEWISVKDEYKPPLAKDEKSISIPVLLYVPRFAEIPWGDPIVKGNYLYHSGRFRPEGSSGCEDLVTHWQPLLAPPEKG